MFLSPAPRAVSTLERTTSPSRMTLTKPLEFKQLQGVLFSRTMCHNTDVQRSKNKCLLHRLLHFADRLIRVVWAWQRPQIMTRLTSTFKLLAKPRSLLSREAEVATQSNSVCSEIIPQVPFKLTSRYSACHYQMTPPYHLLKPLNNYLEKRQSVKYSARVLQKRKLLESHPTSISTGL